MPPNHPISDHDKAKKEILVLPYDQVMVLSALVLSNSSTTKWDLLTVLNNAAARSNTAGWNDSRMSRALNKLVKAQFIYVSFRSLSVYSHWEVPAFFAADALKKEDLVSLIMAINSSNAFPDDASFSSRWGINLRQLTLRCLHKILLNAEQEFSLLFRAIEEQDDRLAGQKNYSKLRIQKFLSVIDEDFWKKRGSYFRWLGFIEQQFQWRSWREESMPAMAASMTKMREELVEGDFSEEIRTIATLGMHYFGELPGFLEYDQGLVGINHLRRGDKRAALAAFTALPVTGEDIEAGFIHICQQAMLYGAGKINQKVLAERSATFTTSEFPRMVNCFLAYVWMETDRPSEGEALLEKQFNSGLSHPLEWLTGLLCAAWMGVRLRRSVLDDLIEGLEEEEYNSIPWIRDEIRACLQLLFPHSDIWGAQPQVQGTSSLLALLPVREGWEYALRQLRDISEGKGKEEAKPEFRSIWIVNFDTREAYCKEQKAGKKGWSKGRKLKWYQLITPKYPEAMEPADTAAISALMPIDGRRLSSSMVYNDDSLRLDFGRLLYEITDHPRVYLGESRRIPIELIRAEPELMITETSDGILLRFEPAVEEGGYVWKKETPTRYRVYHLSPEQAKMAWAIGEGVELPASQRAALEGMVEELRPAVRVQSTFDLIDEDLPQVKGETIPCFHLLPFGEGYKVELYVKPVPDAPYYFKPGDGMPRGILVLEEGRIVLERDLETEKDEAANAILSCPTLARTSQAAYEWVIEDTTTALRILLELRALVAEKLVVIEHPKGEKLKIVGQAGSDELAIRVGKQRDWFEVDGKLTVNEDRVLDLERLLEHLRMPDNPFIELGEGEFLAITEELRDRVLEMEGLLHRRGDKLQLPTLAASAFADVAEGLDDLEFDDAWRESLERISRADKIRPRVPKDFKAELRDYQKEGFRWLMRLAEWGVGGCLADDMGLGKTVQALAMLTARAGKGPSLVIAPASVTRNWMRETERFAPGLIPVLIASRSDTALLTQLGTGDLALVSYGLLPFIAEELAEIPFANIVLDEAQAIKNAATKRAKAVQNLQGDFKLATTGTPIENHLGELWSLFRFLNPGLLSGKSAFNEKYNKPIARDGNDDRRRALKNLVKPFILRRRKDEVLTELPPKTEIVLSVDLSEEEKALYEALRRQAVKEIAAADEQQKRFTVLAQLTKLRQAACHPRLVRPTSKIGSAKLELVGETLLEILENGHKALIFSQFVKHLKIVENWVKGQEIAYQYLDGSTPGAKREQAVNAFQAGEGEVFLISLKAGGTGLNLTAADYVLHLDPWWNPAAEDQASDRAHRIGQQRPVTVYRFVSEGTIEEQIIALHAEKRDLADQILSGTGNAGKLGVEEILALIRE